MNTLRTPSEARPPRMEALARLPVFFALAGKRAVIAGGSAAAAWKAELLSAAGAVVDVYAADPSEEMYEVAAHANVAVHRREIAADDLANAAMAIGDFASDTDAAAFAALARRAGVPVNVIDKPGSSDFAFGAIVNRSPLVVGISTDGAAPVFGQAIRAKLEALIPQGFARWAEAARQWRPRVQALALSFRERRRFWERFTALAAAEPNRAPVEADIDALMGETRGVARDAGSVMLVGAGPGDPELLTLRAVRALQSADVILIDDLVSPEILDFARREAKKMLVGKTGHGPACRQDEINALMVKLAKAGKRVVRLKGGDPMIFGRAGEEIEACRAASIPVEVVPGISAAQGAAARLLVSLTHRAQARRLQYITGHDRDGALPADIDWRALADPAATTVVYMPKKTLRALGLAAVAHGLDPATPAVAVANATRPDEAIVAGTIADIAGRIDAAAPDGPALVMIGRVLAHAAHLRACPARSPTTRVPARSNRAPATKISAADQRLKARLPGFSRLMMG
jgi:uroporphyrin-III C-methyltransferase / precorrin-2 dehydrogenase / sirohydrochlorin ferrochelatase